MMSRDDDLREQRIEAAKVSYCRGFLDLDGLDGTLHNILTPEPPRDSGEADAVHGPTALRTQHDIGTKGEPAR